LSCAHGSLLTENINPEKSLVNGTMARMHSLSFSNGPPAKLVAHESNGGGYGHFELLSPPLSVNVVPEREQRDSNEAAARQSLVKSEDVVPILQSTFKEARNLTGVFAATRNMPKEVRVSVHKVMLAFAMTDCEWLPRLHRARPKLRLLELGLLARLTRSPVRVCVCDA
jgi:hypothetical protein